ncbi:hypothetical protein COU01_02810 [Candidatus Falkowbacteria bacterium CG10_big_fil_rev_8_21_14_0_10_44_15]|uniref:Acylneuraminate cytidylyltransferase family protein n=1 Tax=Candidatus Falkowbacteria bacterium CG10_big_fil_rev_8_21_14_0_10_44_15 TaxID=1974569 RepID=A0A2H0UZJ3_9BACT|nr:MAG: hypothetical protein COU01_02810 [Candidatus Falkowbacteria bacterium CG10_big_fil_rev_8_21_14_0_10_44_15]
MLKTKEKAVAIIIARGGSKSIPRKNILPLNGKPLVAWPIELAKSVDRIDRVIVSTDDTEIMSIAKKYGAEVPFIRPYELANDEAETLPVLQHCVKYLEEVENYKAEIIVLLYPTAPLLKAGRVNEALDLFEKSRCNSVVSVAEDRGHYWINENSKLKRLYPIVTTNRQIAKPCYKEDGAIYFNRYDAIMNVKTIVDENSVEFLLVNENENIDIDELNDFIKAENKIFNQ